MLNSERESGFEKVEYDSTLKEFGNGDIVRGRVVEIRDNDVFVDIGYKSEGVINIKEFEDEEGNINVNVGDEIEALFLNRLDENGFEKLSKIAADRLKGWNRVLGAYEKNEPIEGVIKKLVTGGFSVDIGGFLAFLPGSQVEMHPIRNYQSYVGRRFEFKVININKQRKNAVVSRKVILEEEKERKAKEIEEKIKKDAVLEGRVKNITDYGVFVDLGGVDGLVHITHMSWKRISHPSEMVKISDIIKVKVLNIEDDGEHKKIYLGMKQLTENPWDNIEEKLKEGDIVNGKLVNIVDYGLFVELENGVEGLVHKSEVSYDNDPAESMKEYSVGDTVKVKVLSVDAENKRISLSIKQAKEDPWNSVAERYREGDIVEGKVTSVKEFGVFVRLEEGVEGLVHKNDISWDKDEQVEVNVGDIVKAVVLSVDQGNRKIALGFKQLTEDPWSSVDERYKVGDLIRVRVVSVKNFGAFVKVEKGIESLVPRSEFNGYVPKDGEELKVKILKLDKEKKKFICQIVNE